MDSLGSLLFGRLFGDYESADKVGRTEIEGYTVDTCDTVDCGYETAIWYQDNAIVIVERYSDREQAISGHDKWVEFCKTKPSTVYSVQLDEECELK